MSGKYFIMGCIDYRYDHLVAEYFEAIGQQNNYYYGTVAGSGALAYGYKCFCKCQCKKDCNPNDKTIALFKDNLQTNLDISLTLSPVETVYLLAHNDCGAMKAFLPCSGYPDKLGEDNQKERDIYAKLLEYAKAAVLKKNPKQKVRMGVIDYNGTVADWNGKSWVVIYKGTGKDPKALWWNY